MRILFMGGNPDDLKNDGTAKRSSAKVGVKQASGGKRSTGVFFTEKF